MATQASLLTAMQINKRIDEMADKRNKMTPEIHNKIVHMLLDGKTGKEIQADTGFSISTIMGIRKNLKVGGEIKSNKAVLQDGNINTTAVLGNNEVIQVLQGLTQAEEKLLGIWLKDVENKRRVLALIYAE